MAESLESLVEKFRVNLTEAIQKLEEENHEKEATLEAEHQKELELLGEKEYVEREQFDAKQKVERELFDAKQSQRLRHLTVKQHQEKEKLKNDYGVKMKDTKENKLFPKTSKKEVPECPVCLEPLNPPMRIFQCSYGHYLCENCNNNKEIKSCPTCRRQIVGRNIGMEQAIQLIGAPTNKVVQNQQKSGVKSLIDGRGLACGKCTLINKEGDKFCDVCGATLGMVYSPIRPATRNFLDFSPLMRPTEGRLGQSPAHSGHGQSLGRPGQSRPLGVDRDMFVLPDVNSNLESGDHTTSVSVWEACTLKSLSLPYKIGDEFLVKCLIQTSVDSFYCHLFTSEDNNAESFVNLSSNLQALGDQQPLVQDPKIGMAVIARCKQDRKWRRAVVLNCYPTSVLFVDFGNSQQVDEVRSLPTGMDRLPKQAVLLRVVPAAMLDEPEFVSPHCLIRCRLKQVRKTLTPKSPIATVQILKW